MAVEIFLNEEVEELQEEEVLLQWNEIVSDLNLKGQQKLCSQSEDKSGVIPYTTINDRMARVINTLCPSRTSYEEYSYSQIPLEVLQEIKKCIDHNWFSKIQIHYAQENKDPFVIGLAKDGSNDWNATKYLIARFGDEMLPWEELENKAGNMLLASMKQSMATLEADRLFIENNPKEAANSALNGKSFFGMTVQASSNIYFG